MGAFESCNIIGYGDDSLAIEALNEGAQDFIMKSEFNAEIIYRSLKYSIERKRLYEISKKEREFLKSLFDNIPIYIAISSY